MRNSVIAFFLFRPDFSDFALTARVHLPEDERVRFKIYFTAAMLLQQIHSTRLRQYVNNWTYIPDRFSIDLLLSETETPQERLLKSGKLQ